MTADEQRHLYVEDDPDIEALAQAYKTTIRDLDTYFDQCRDNYNQRRNIWPGKTRDLRKNHEDAFPWKGASDQEANTIGERIDTYVALGMQALGRANIRAYPSQMTGMPRARAVSNFLKWMRHGYIPNFMEEMEQAWNYGLEKGLMVTYCGWQKEERTVLQRFSMDAIAASDPEIAEMIVQGADDEGIAEMFRDAYPRLSKRRAMKAVRDLRKKGVAELTTAMVEIDRPWVESLLPDGEVFFPNWTKDVQRAPYVFWRRLLTAQEIKKKVVSEGWDKEWAEYVIEHLAGHGVDQMLADDESIHRSGSDLTQIVGDDEKLYQVVCAYRRMIDPEDGSEGIYKTVFSPDYSDAYAMHELMDGYHDYPFVVTRMENSAKALYDVRALPERLKGPQWAIKVERDSRIDRNSMATLPPMEIPAGKPPADFGPGRYIPVRRRGEYGFVEPPPAPNGSIEIEQTMNLMADRAVGLDYTIPNAPLRQQFMIGKLLTHAREVLRRCYKNFQKYGADEVFFTVTGVPDPVTLENVRDEDFHIQLDFDVLAATDPDTVKARAEQMSMLFSLDRTGRLDAGKFVEFAAVSIDPAFADMVMVPQQENERQLVKAITDDFAKLYAGMGVGPQPNGAEATLQMLQQWTQSPDVAQRLQNDEAFAARVQNYAEQAQFQITQAQNAQIGRLGAAPAEFQGTNL